MKRIAQLAVGSILLFSLFTFLLRASAQRRLETVPAGAQASRQIPETRENVDLRSQHRRSIGTASIVDAPQERGAMASRARSVGESRLKRAHRNLEVRWSSLSEGPSRVLSLTEPLTGPSDADAEATARRFLRENEDLFRLKTREVDGLSVGRRFRTDHNGMTHLTLAQKVNGLEVFQAEYTIHLDRDGRVIAANGELIPEIAAAVNASRAGLSAAEALRIAAREVGQELTGPLTIKSREDAADQRQTFDKSAGFGDDVPARLLYFPLSSTQVRLAWQITVSMRDTPDMYYVIIDAARGSLLYRNNLTCYFDENPLKPHGLVYTKESPRPNVPRTGSAPPEVQREDLPFRATPFNGKVIFNTSDPHFDWWAAATADRLISNNTTTYLDRDSTANVPDEPRLQVPDGNYTFPVDLTLAPTEENNQKAAQVNLFYWINRYHDILYGFGFNEASGNFQTNNFMLGGVGNDAIRGEAQDGSGTNNANFSTPADGSPGRVQMFLWTGTPQRDGDFDQGVIIHELTHGLSNRLIGNGNGLGSTQDRGMGEGWSDWFGLVLLAQENDNLSGEYAVGQFVTNNYVQGIRRFPYSTNKTLSPLTYKDVPLNTGVHPIGEIWCNALWEMRAQLVQKYGFQEGQRQAIQLVVDGMKLTPVIPTFLDARNAIILADRVNNGGANQCLLWQAFAKRGIGFRADSNDASDVQPIESLETAPYCSDAGILAIDKAAYVPGEQVKISLGDRNATGAVAVQIQSTATGDQETLTLTPESGIAGSYLGALRFSAGAARPNDGVLQGSAERADQISIIYNDPNNGAGQGAQIRASAIAAREKAAFADTVDQGNQGWLPTGTWAITRLRAASGTSSWTDSPAGNYANASSVTLTSPLLDLTGLTEITLSFANSYNMEDRFDYGMVEFSIDDGATWSRALSYTGSQQTFSQARVALRALDQKPRARVRFRLATDAADVRDGWFIDDIQITGRSASPTVVPGVAPPVIASLSPAFGSPAGGTRVTINGSGFTENETTSVSFDGLAATSFSVLSSTVISAVTPAHAAGAVVVRVDNRSGAASLQNGFTYYATGAGGPAPALTTLFPNAGTVRGGTPVTIIGAGFTPETEVTFGAQRGAVTFINANTLRAATPAGTATGAIEVAVANGPQRTAIAGGYSYTSASPPTAQLQAPMGGETFFIRGTMAIRWTSSDDRAVARHRVQLVRAGTNVTDLVNDLPGNEQSFIWTIPNGTIVTNQARIRVIAVDDEGGETETASTADFAIAQRWENLTTLPTSLQRIQIAGDGRYLYSFGGRGTNSSATTVTTGYRFDTTAPQPQWTTDIAAMPRGLNGGDAVFLKGKIYIPGGFDSTVALANQHYAYDIAANTWATVASPAAGALLYALVADDPRSVFYMIGGNNGQASIANVRSYAPETNAWSDLPSLSAARNGHNAAMIDGKLYVAGGQNATGSLTTGETYDFGTQKWTPIAPLNQARLFATDFVGRDAAGNPFWFLIGGQTAEGALLGSEVYDVRNNRWFLLDNSFTLNTPRALAGGATVGDFFYAVSGATPTTSVRSHERTRVNGIAPIPFNLPPALAVPADLVAVAGTELRFNVIANDLGSGTPLAITATGLPSGAAFTTETVTNNSARGAFRWTPSASDVGQKILVRFSVGDGQFNNTKTVSLRVVSASPLAAVNAADFRTGALAADSIAAAFGTNLAVRTEIATAQPLPTELAGTTVTINGVAAPLFFVSATQINFAVPSSIEPGPATIIVSNPAGAYAAGMIQIAAAAPSIFTADATGRGDAAAVATADGITFQQPPFDVTVNGRPNILLLFGTGFRRAAAANPNDENGVAESVAITIGGLNASVLYAGSQGGFAGLDQLNVEIPAALAGQGPRRVEVVTTVNGATANRVTIQIK
ncbi:MAG: M36 family metallopeptidase [Blastocatellia bacterium]|nr:M36 family metallopeptidase [Blastocatellia bacterium]